VGGADSERDAEVKTAQTGRAAKKFIEGVGWLETFFPLNFDQQREKVLKFQNFAVRQVLPCITCRKARVTYRRASCDSGDSGDSDSGGSDSDGGDSDT
jgi:hypothetical protein